MLATLKLIKKTPISHDFVQVANMALGLNMTNVVQRRIMLSMPLVLMHKTIAQCTCFEVADKIVITLVAAAPSSSACGRVDVALRWWWVIRRARLQPDRGIWIKMARDSLDSGWNTTLLLVHSRSALPSGSSCRLCI